MLRQNSLFLFLVLVLKVTHSHSPPYINTPSFGCNSQTSITMAESTLTVFLILILTGCSSSRDLRPSEHGLLVQTLSPAGTHSSPEMRSFFNTDNSSPTVSSSSSSDFAMPNAITTDNPTPRPPSGMRGSGDGDRVGDALKAASLACGIVGGFLILASSLIYVIKYRKRVQNEAFCGNNGEFENDDGNNKLQLVLRDPSS